MIFHAVLITLALLPFLRYPDPPPGQEGILVNLGLPDQGQGTENAPPDRSEEEVDPPPQPEPEVSEPAIDPEPEPVPEEEIIQSEDPEEIAIREEAERRKREQAEAERREREEAERKLRQREAAERKRREEEARRKAKADKLKDDLGELFGDGEGKGETGKQGNQGDQQGNPDESKLEGISKGVGTVGGGLSSRGVLASPQPQDNSQDAGTVVVSVCVDRAGKVVSANYTQRGTTASSSRLIKLAESNARRWKFAEGDIDKQCGTITYRFKVQ